MGRIGPLSYPTITPQIWGTTTPTLPSSLTLAGSRLQA